MAFELVRRFCKLISKVERVMNLTSKSKSLSFTGAVIAAGALTAANAWAEADWPSAGADLSNSRYQDKEHRISANTVSSLQLKWTFTTDGDVTAHPTVDGKYLYFPDSAGSLYKVEKKTGALVWKKPISSYTGIANDVARATPAVAGKLLILGNLSGRFIQAFGQPAPQPAHVFALDKDTGDPVWNIQVDSNPLSFVTNSAVVYKDTAFVGVASNEELIAAFVPPANWQWQFRGSVLALDVKTGKIKWQTYTVPANTAPPNMPSNGYYGGSVWGSTGAVDEDDNLVFMTTGNNYAVPQSCLTNSSACSPDNHVDSIIALDMDTGKIKWAARGMTSDAWNVACGLSSPGFVIGPGYLGVYGNCPYANPSAAGPDYDFAQGPMLLDGGLVGAGEKSGIFWAFHRKTGALAWMTQAAPGGITGGLQWGSATDGDRIFVAASNSGTALAGGGTGAMPWKLKNGTTVTSGGWAALDRKTGAVLWTTPDPVGSRSEAPVSAANDVVFGCNLAFGVGTMVAMNAKTGTILWSYNSGGLCNAGASISDGMVFWGNGTFAGTGVRKVFAFGLPRKPGDDDDN
jgi:polyvinyl alcohol dehydrogenase (cytochrome)